MGKKNKNKRKNTEEVVVSEDQTELQPEQTSTIVVPEDAKEVTTDLQASQNDQ